MGLKKIRGRKPIAESERKSRIIQTRVPQDLEDSLRETADKKRVSVSHLIRNVLLDTFELVDGVVADSTNLANNAVRDAQRIADSANGLARDNSAALDEVDSWQDVIVNKVSNCAECKSLIKKGARAYRGLTTNAQAQPLWLCTECIEKL